ncbi:unnamed protein product, partial [Allacma fusca]
MSKVSASKKKFAVVIYEEKETCVVPLTWVTTDQNNCYWPDVSGPRVASLLTNPNSIPKKTWELRQARVLGRYKTLKSAREAEVKATETSAIEIDSENDEVVPRRRKLKPKLNSVVADLHESEEDPSNLTVVREIRAPSVGLFETTGFQAIQLIGSESNFNGSPLCDATGDSQASSEELIIPIVTSTFGTNTEANAFQIILSGCEPAKSDAATQTDLKGID